MGNADVAEQAGEPGAMTQEQDQKLKVAGAKLKQLYQEHHTVKMSRFTKCIVLPVTPIASANTKVVKPTTSLKKSLGGGTRGMVKGRLMHKSRKDFAMYLACRKLAF